MTLGEWVAFLV